MRAAAASAHPFKTGLSTGGSAPLLLRRGSEISEHIKKFTKRNDISGCFQLKSDGGLMINKSGEMDRIYRKELGSEK